MNLNTIENGSEHFGRPCKSFKMETKFCDEGTTYENMVLIKHNPTEQQQSSTSLQQLTTKAGYLGV